MYLKYAPTSVMATAGDVDTH